MGYYIRAPFLSPGGYIDWEGGGGEAWRYKFDGSTMKTIGLEYRKVEQ